MAKRCAPWYLRHGVSPDLSAAQQDFPRVWYYNNPRAGEGCFDPVDEVRFEDCGRGMDDSVAIARMLARSSRSGLTAEGAANLLRCARHVRETGEQVMRLAQQALAAHGRGDLDEVIAILDFMSRAEAYEYRNDATLYLWRALLVATIVPGAVVMVHRRDRRYGERGPILEVSVRVTMAGKSNRVRCLIGAVSERTRHDDREFEAGEPDYGEFGVTWSEGRDMLHPHPEVEKDDILAALDACKDRLWHEAIALAAPRAV